MFNMIVTDYLTFTEWYHYALLFLWLVMLFIGIKYFSLFESHFKPRDGFAKGENYGKGLLSASFVIGLLMILVFTFKPAQSVQSEVSWDYAEYIFYGLFILLLAFNAFVSIRYYFSPGGIVRMALMSVLMLLYFYSGMLGGLMVIAVVVLFILIFAVVKLKKIMTIR